jgi:hypothetical protein
MALKNFNRIINLTLYKSVGVFGDMEEIVIKCPTHGRKPSIEINGTYTTANFLPAFNLTIKNLYINMTGAQYKKVKVEAGYEGNTVTFEGTILTMYQDEPGPESKTVIQCQMGQMQQWLDTAVQLTYEAGTPLQTVLKDIGAKLKTEGVHIGLKAGTLQLKTLFVFDGTARNALSRLETYYADEKLVLFVRENILCAVCMPGEDFVKTSVLEYMSAPPQENPGDEDGALYTTITAPWQPKLQIGDLLRIPSKVYMRNFSTVGAGAKTQTIQVTALSFHFGTTGGTNSMQVQGFNTRLKNGQ